MDAPIPIDFMSSPATVQFFGRAWLVKAEILIALQRGEPLAPIAKRHKITVEGVRKQARIARRLWPQLKVDSAK